MRTSDFWDRVNIATRRMFLDFRGIETAIEKSKTDICREEMWFTSQLLVKICLN